MSDIGQNEIKQNLTGEILLTTEEIELHKIFGNEAKLENNGDNWKVYVQLKDGVCHGGQTVEAELERKGHGKRSWYEAKELLVDGVSLPTVFKNPFIFTEPTQKSEVEAVDQDIFLHLKKFIGTRALDGGLVQIVSLEDGDGLASVFHEIGHSRDSTPSAFNEMSFYIVQEYVTNEGKGHFDLKAVKESAEKILEFEMVAHKFAIKAVNFLRNKGNDMFKDDEELLRFRKFLITTTMARFNGAPKFIELLGADRINRILDL